MSERISVSVTNRTVVDNRGGGGCGALVAVAVALIFALAYWQVGLIILAVFVASVMSKVARNRHASGAQDGKGDS